MKISIHNAAKPLQILAAASICFATPMLCRAQEPQDAVAQVQQPIAAPLLDEKMVREEPGLQAPVTFEAKRQQISEVLAALQVQSGVTLTVTPGSPLASRLLTARAKAMPLAQVLASLSRLYGVAWVKQGQAFEMRSNERSVLDNTMWKLSSTAYNGDVRVIDDPDPIDWNQEVANLGVARLQQKEGVAFEELPEDIARKLRAQSEAQDVPKLGLALDAARLPNLMGSRVEISDESTLDGTKLSVKFFAPDGKLLGQRVINVVPNAK